MAFRQQSHFLASKEGKKRDGNLFMVYIHCAWPTTLYYFCWKLSSSTHNRLECNYIEHPDVERCGSTHFGWINGFHRNFSQNFSHQMFSYTNGIFLRIAIGMDNIPTAMILHIPKVNSCNVEFSKWNTVHIDAMTQEKKPTGNVKTYTFAIQIAREAINSKIYLLFAKCNVTNIMICSLFTLRGWKITLMHPNLFQSSHSGRPCRIIHALQIQVSETSCYICKHLFDFVHIPSHPINLPESNPLTKTYLFELWWMCIIGVLLCHWHRQVLYMPTQCKQIVFNQNSLSFQYIRQKPFIFTLIQTILIKYFSIVQWKICNSSMYYLCCCCSSAFEPWF